MQETQSPLSLVMSAILHASKRGLALFALFAAFIDPLNAGQPSKPDFPQGLRLTAKTRGEAAISALGDRLPELAAHYNKTPEELRKLFREDETLWADADGKLFYACQFHGHHKVDAEETPESASESIGPTDVAPFDTDEAFLLNSRPGANRVIYLDFDGHVDNTPGNWKDGASAPPFDIDADPATFNSTERTRIIYVWQRVAEDFAMFDINVTTQDPGIEALRKTNASDQQYGMRCCIGGSSGGAGDWYTSSAGGVAFVGNFDASNDVPCWVFPENLGNSEKNIAEAASHEVGHTLGLNHDGIVNGADYFSGHGNWAPIMGVGYNRPISQWSKGEYSNADNTQDDLAVMLTQGAVYRTDDHGSTLAAATVITAADTPYETNAVIERNTDVDFFQITALGGPLSITVKPAPRGANLRIEIELYDAAGTLLQTATAADTTGGTQPVTLTRTVAAGNYRFSVDGVGSGDPLSSGYSDYSSLGQYLISISGIVFTNPLWEAVAAGSYTWNVTSNWYFDFFKNEAGSTMNVHNNIAANQTINITSTATLGNLSLGDSDSTHAFTLAGSSLAFNNLPAVSNLTKTSGGADIISAPIILSGGLAVHQSDDSGLTMSGPVSGAGPLTKTGSGTLNLSAANTYSGVTNIQDGTIFLGNTNALQGTSAITIAGGSALSTSTDGIIIGVPITLGAAGTQSTIAFSRSSSNTGSLRLNGLISGAGGLIFTTPSSANSGNNLQAIILGSAPNTYGGPTTITTANSGNTVTVRAGVANSLPTTTVLTLDGGDGSGTGRTVTFDLNGFNQTLAGLNNVTGLNLRNQRVTNSGAAATLTINNSGNHTYQTPAALTGALALTKQGAGTLTLNSLNSHSGATTISAGVLDIRHADALGATTADTTVANGAVLQLQGGINVAAEPLNLQSGSSSTPMLKSLSGDNIWNGTIASTGSGSVTRISSDAGLLTLDNTITGSSATTQIVLQGAGSILVNGRITGSSRLTSSNTGAGIRTLANTNNDFTGSVTLNGGTLKLGANEVIPNGPGKSNVTMLVGSILDLASFSETINGFSSTGTDGTVDNTVAGTPLLTIGDNNQTSSFGGIIRNTAGTMALTKTGSGSLTLTGDRTYSGNTTVNQGTLSLSKTNPSDNSAFVTIAATGATLNLAFSGTDTVARLYIGGTWKPAGVYGAVGSTSPVIGIAQITGTGTLTVTSGPVQNYTSWQTANGNSQPINGDHDNDGVLNGIEYFIGGANTTTGFNTLPGVTQNAGVHSVTWTKAADYPGAYGTHFYVETSSTLTGGWTTETLGANVTITGNQVKYTFPTGLMKFARLKVTGP